MPLAASGDGETGAGVSHHPPTHGYLSRPLFEQGEAQPQTLARIIAK